MMKIMSRLVRSVPQNAPNNHMITGHGLTPFSLTSAARFDEQKYIYVFVKHKLILQ